MNISIRSNTGILFIFILFVFMPSYTEAANYYTIGDGPIPLIREDSIEGQILIQSAESIFSINTSDGSIIDDLSIQGIYLRDIQPGTMDGGKIFGIGGFEGTSILFAIERSTGYIENTIYPANLGARKLVQNDTKLFAASVEHKLYTDYVNDFVCVYDKSDISFIEMWFCTEKPGYAIYDINNDTIIIGGERLWSRKPGVQYYVPRSPGVIYYSKIGLYDTVRGGLLLQEYEVGGRIGGLAVMDDGTIVVGLYGECAYQEEAATLAIIDEGVNYLDIENYAVKFMDCDPATDRIFAVIWEGDLLTGRVLVWDYSTFEHSLLDFGVQGISVIKFADGKLFGSTWDDNKLYVIDLD